MKKEYLEPEMDIEVWLGPADILCSSGFGGSPGNDDEGEIEEGDD